jgi:Zn-dependent M28 family amino/carboxypeptidase
MSRGVVLALLASLVIGASAATEARAQRVDGAQLLEDVRVLAADSLEGRRTGSRGARRAQAYIRSAMEARGVKPFGTAYDQTFPVTVARGGTQYEGVNLIGQIRGTVYPDSFIVLTAHYDHLGVRDGIIHNGADDNASGVAVLLAAAAHFSRAAPRHSILFAALDAEELGLEGANAFVAAPPVPLSNVILNVNLDMVSRSDSGELYVAGTSHSPFLAPVVERVAARSRIQLLPGYDQPSRGAGHDWTSSSDHAVFHEAGIPFLYFGVEDHADYHRPTDDFERIDPIFFIRSAETILDALVEIDATWGSLRPR